MIPFVKIKTGKIEILLDIYEDGDYPDKKLDNVSVTLRFSEYSIFLSRIFAAMKAIFSAGGKMGTDLGLCKERTGQIIGQTFEN